MRKLLAIVIIHWISHQIEAQIIFPDAPELQSNYNPPIQTVSQRRTNHAQNPTNNVEHTSLEYDKHVEQIAANGISNLAISINNFYLNHKGLDNIVFSPACIAGALALILLGSNGKTFAEIAAVMGLSAGADITTNSQMVHENLGKLFQKLDRSSDPSDQIKVAAAIFIQENFPIRDLYKQTSERIYKNEILNVDFRTNSEHAQRVINNWVTNKTNGKIKSLLAQPPPEDTKVIIASALYFNGAWERQFWEGFTRRRPFYPNGRKTYTNIEIEMMSNGGMFPYHRDTLLDCDIMGFPYKGNATTMYVIIPQHSNVQKLKSFAASLTSADILRLVQNTAYTQSVVLFPKIKLEASNDLTEPLKYLGAKSLFNPFEANLGVLSPGMEQRQYGKTKQIYSSSVNRKTFNSPPGSDSHNQNDVLIFNRFGSPANCTQMIFNPNSNISECEEIDTNTQKQVAYKKFGDKLGRRATRDAFESVDNLRQQLNSDPYNSNPGLYADQVLHKVYIDITERGTEAAASTSVSLTRGGDITIFRADIPFLFFIWHEQTKLILFWGTVYEPTSHVG